MYKNVQEYLQVKFPLGQAKIQHQLRTIYMQLFTVAWGTKWESNMKLKEQNTKSETQCQNPLFIWPNLNCSCYRNFSWCCNFWYIYYKSDISMTHDLPILPSDWERNSLALH